MTKKTQKKHYHIGTFKHEESVTAEMSELMM